MNNEFKKLSQGNITRYILENASSGGTSSGSVASIPMPASGTRKRGDNLIAQEADKNTIPSSTPRNFVAKNAKSSGAGAHKDKTKTIPRKEKHKKPFMEDHTTASGGWGHSSYDTYTAGNHGRGVAEEDDTEQELGMAGSELYGMAKHAKELLALVHQQSQGLEAWQQSKITKAADYLNSVLQSLDYDTNGEQGVTEGLDSDRCPQCGMKGCTCSPGKCKCKPIAGWVPNKGFQKAMAEGAEFGAYYSEKVAQEIFDKRQDITSEDEVLNQAYHIVSNELGQKTAHYKFNYDEDFTSDVVSNYFYLQKQGVAEGGFKQTPGQRQYGALHSQLKSMANSGQINTPAGKQKAEKIIDAIQQLVDTDPSCAGSTVPSKKIWLSEQGVAEEWSQKYKNSINCSHPKGFSQKAHCAGKKKHNESTEMEMTCPDCGMCETHGNIMEIKKGQKDANGYTRCWPGKHAVGTKKGKNGGQVRDCRPNEDIAEVAPKGWEGTVKAMKKHKDIDNPWALAWSMKNKGYKSHKKESVDPYFESLDRMLERQLEPTMDLDTWNNNFQNADPNKYHQFKNKTPEKKK